MGKENYSRVEIKSAEGTMTEVYIDGHLVRGVRHVKFEKRAGNMPTLTVDLNALDISIDSPFVLKHEGFDDIDITFDGRHKLFNQ